jgi:hypothetical protein
MATHRKIHASITINRIMAALEEAANTVDNPGICFSCGEWADGCEPDMRHGECEHCGARQVFGLEETLLIMA